MVTSDQQTNQGVDFLKQRESFASQIWLSSVRDIKRYEIFKKQRQD